MFDLSSKFYLRLPFLIIAIFLVSLIYLAIIHMQQAAFNEFDEAHRAETAKRMKEYKSFFVPLSGSPQDRYRLRIPFSNDTPTYLYYHLERPFFVYLLMIGSSSVFGDTEWAYRLPSFILGMLTIGVFTWFLTPQKKDSLAFSVGLLSLVTCSSLWLSAQYAQLDTGLTYFLFLALVGLLKFIDTKKQIWLVIGGLSYGLAILSKGQPAVIFLIPILFLVIVKRLDLKSAAKFLGFTTLLFLPWFLYISLRFGLETSLKIFFGFAFNSAAIPFLHNQAPIYWYLRFWWENFRPGWSLFLTLFILDILKGKLVLIRQLLAVYSLGSLLILSLPTNKLWWYVLPLVPVICWYIFLSTKDYLEDKKSKLWNLSLIIFLSSIPLFIHASNKTVLIYGVLLTMSCIIILRLNLSELPFKKAGFLISLIVSLTIFYLRFPQIIPYSVDLKPAGLYLASIAGSKCLYVLDIPAESLLFYSNAGEARLLTVDTKLSPQCANYLATSREIKNPNAELIYTKGEIKIYRLKGESIK